jgi:hypothetical protein
LQSQYTLSLLLFVTDNKDLFLRNFEVHQTNARNKSSLHQPSSKLSIYERGHIVLESGYSIVYLLK